MKPVAMDLRAAEVVCCQDWPRRWPRRHGGRRRGGPPPRAGESLRRHRPPREQARRHPPVTVQGVEAGEGAQPGRRIRAGRARGGRTPAEGARRQAAAAGKGPPPGQLTSNCSRGEPRAQIPAAPFTGAARPSPAAASGGDEGREMGGGGGGAGRLGFRPPGRPEETTQRDALSRSSS